MTPIKELCFTADKVYACGDLHGAFGAILPNIATNEITNAVLIVCGDIGIGFKRKAYYNETFERMSKPLVDANVHLILFRGNHDNPRYFDGRHWTDDRFMNIHVIPDYTVLNINGGERYILCVGGAISIDRVYRMDCNALAKADKEAGGLRDRYAPQYYWADEPPVYNRNKLLQMLEQGYAIDTVCAHTCPSSAHPKEKGGVVGGWAGRDINLLADLDEERWIMDKIADTLIEKGHPLRQWVYGHFHEHHDETKAGIRFLLLSDVYNGKLDFEII